MAGLHVLVEGYADEVASRHGALAIQAATSFTPLPHGGSPQTEHTGATLPNGRARCPDAVTMRVFSAPLTVRVARRERSRWRGARTGLPSGAVDDGATEDPQLDDEGSPRALVQEASCAERVVVLKVRVPGRTSLVIVGATRSGPSGAALVAAEARREVWGGKLPPGAVRQRAREDALAGARVVALGPNEAFIDQHGSARVIRAEGGRVVVTDDRPGSAAPFVSLSDDERTELEGRGLAIARAIAADAFEARRTEIARLLERAAQRIERRREAIRGDLDKIAQADRIASQAQWLIAEAARAPRGAKKLVVTDWSKGD